MTLEPAFDAFERAYRNGEPQVVHRRVVDDLETPVSAYLKLGHARPYAFLFESVEGGAWRGRYSIIALKPDLVWRCFGDRAETARGGDVDAGRFTPEAAPALQSLRALVDASRIDLPAGLPPMAAGLFGVFGYDMVRLSEPLGEAGPDPLDLPDAVLARPSVVAVFDAIAQEIVLATPVRSSELSAEEAYAAARARLGAVEDDLRRPLAPSGPRTQPTEEPAFGSSMTPQEFEAKVLKSKDYIAAGDIFQVVLSQRFEASFEHDPFAFYRSLRRMNPSPFLFHLDFGGFQLSGSSPEILVRLRDGKVTIRPIAGTRPRGATPEQDLALEQELLADPKERAEHLMLLDLGRNDVGRVSKPGTVRVTESFAIERYSHVMHIVSNVEGDAAPQIDPVDALLAALPAGTLSGAPKVRAMEIIDELEGLKRGVTYGGGAGYISAGGAVDACIVLRTALFKDGRMYVQAGAGVVADSNPTAEYEETLHKSRALKRAAEECWRFG
ncbi:anthranilate synthase component I [Caulobacter sp. 17J80-11]|uniref:anthranilate synthase component I n=1 Tax=Caulobacter sp. 17J80-11 TaxID=2763502 RepID=UPI0016537AFE|nr:anthranilate synthase component I [Caulobacter sp. 17J80-11]MBC6980780.1 anthranilate synthase component I [Caulobacter sp. 17J80-11]